MHPWLLDSHLQQKQQEKYLEHVKTFLDPACRFAKAEKEWNRNRQLISDNRTKLKAQRRTNAFTKGMASQN